jgi:hypothetical protein
VCLLITNITGELLASGEYHTYRSTLSANGLRLRGLYLRASAEMQTLGAHTASQVADDRNWIEEKIKEAG